MKNEKIVRFTMSKMITIDGLISLILEDLKSRVDFTAEDELDLVVEALGCCLLPNKKVKEKWLQYKEMTDASQGCVAILKSGPARGEQCGRKIKGDGNFCSIHIKHPQPQPQPEVEPDQKIHTVHKDDLVIKPNRWHNFVYPGTCLILDKDKKVAAREGMTGEWLQLTQEDIDLCKKYKLQYKIIDLNFDGEIV